MNNQQRRLILKNPCKTVPFLRRVSNDQLYFFDFVLEYSKNFFIINWILFLKKWLQNNCILISIISIEFVASLFWNSIYFLNSLWKNRAIEWFLFGSYLITFVFLVVDYIIIFNRLLRSVSLRKKVEKITNAFFQKLFFYKIGYLDFLVVKTQEELNKMKG